MILLFDFIYLIIFYVYSHISSVQCSNSIMSNSLQPHRLQNICIPCPSAAPRAFTNSFPSSRCYHPTISSSVVPFSSCLQSFLASRSFPISQFFASSGQSIKASASAHPSSEHSGLISFRIDWLDLLAESLQGTLQEPSPNHSSKASILWYSAFSLVQLSHPHMATGKTTALTIQTFVVRVIFLHFDMLSRLVIAFLPRSKCLLISWLQSPSAVILESKKIVSHSFHCFPIYLP